MNISLEVLDDLSIRKRREHEVLGICPVCGCDDANFNTAKLVWRCWHCDSSGLIYPTEGYEIKEEVVPVLDVPKIRDFYKSLADSFHSTLSMSVKEFLYSRGLTDDTIDKFKLGYCAPDFYNEYDNKIAEDAGVIYQGYSILSNRVIFPYIVNDCITDLRGRVIDSFNYKNNTPKYLSLAGNYESRGATYFFNHDVISQNHTILLTEGEIKALVAVQYGFPMIATPGIYRWTDEWTNLLRDREVILVPDTEIVEKRRTPAYLQAKMLSYYLPNLKVATMLMRKGEEKVDVDTYLITRGAKSFQRVIDCAKCVGDFIKEEGVKSYGRRNGNS